jgi:phosphomannomutase/phosphoglucomutase
VSIYKDCDIRGIYQKEFDEHDAYAIGRSVGSLMRDKTLCVGGDVRLSTAILKENLIQGIVESGCRVVDLGILPTPAFYFGVKKLKTSGGVMVTASHNPPEYNGFKLMFGDMPITEADIAGIEGRIREQDFTRRPGEGLRGSGRVRSENILPAYAAFLKERFLPGGNGALVLDAGNGAMGGIAPEVFNSLGYRAIPLFCESDGRFPNRSPNPAEYKELSALSARVRETGAFMGAAFDGDGDRVIFASETGEIIQSERSLVILIRAMLKNKPGAVVYDLKSSSAVKRAVLEMGGKPLIERSGYTFIKRSLLENHALLGGEVSGHLFFGELGGDDALFAALMMARVIGESGRSFSSLAADVVCPPITDDIRIFCPYSLQDTWLDAIRSLGGSNIEIDGVRAEFPSGWILMRKSVTAEQVTLRIEAENEKSLSLLAEQIASVIPETRQALSQWTCSKSTVLNKA